MYQGLSISRRWLALTLLLFALPLFVGLRSLDLETDEAIYSFAVDRILVDGEWLEPKSSPSETFVFLEKPPLKFWIVAAPIRLGLLPDDELGLRFWDALFGAVAFAYVFAIGSRLAGPVCGVVAVLVLFVHRPLLFEHGLRTNSMEAPLLLAYCGGVFHFLEWARQRPAAGRRYAHAVAAALFFTLGFMTKFVAVVFLPATLMLATLMFRAPRRRFWEERRAWLVAGAVAAAVIVPWFAYAQARFGWLLWETMLSEHIVHRFTTGIDPAHLAPWHYYVTSLWQAFAASKLQWLVAAGVVALVVQALRRRWFDATVIALWAFLPIAAISLGSSKLYHYVYPFLPPFAIAAGYLVALIMMLAPVVLRRWFERLEDRVERYWPAWPALVERPGVRLCLAVLMVSSAIVAAWTMAFGVARPRIGELVLFRSTGVIRPLVVVLLAGIAGRRSGRAALIAVALGVASLMPIGGYQGTLAQLTVEKHPMRDVSQCLLAIERQRPEGTVPGLYVDTPLGLWHPITFYFSRLRPWTVARGPSSDRLLQTLTAPALQPSLVEEQRYRDYLTGADAERFRTGGSPPMMALYQHALLMPGPFRSCSPEAALLREAQP